jgi:bifunctional oligoribonuclease and PAP phosphatase NrnA
MEWSSATELLTAAERIAIVTHVSPDGDAIGSLLGLGHALRDSGKVVTLAVDEGVPSSLEFLPGVGEVQKNLNGAEVDLIIAVDCADESRMGHAGKQARKLQVPLVNLDHHLSNPGFGDANLIDAAWVSASEGVLDWLETMHFALSPLAAQCLLCGIITDTQGFRTDSTKPSTLAKSQRLMERGGDLNFIVQHTLARLSTSTIRLWALVMPTLQIVDHVIWASVTLTARKASGKTGNDTKDGGLSTLILQADDAYVSCIFHEKEHNEVELSMRAVPGFDVASVATALGGGGHRLAAGATIVGSLTEAEARIVPLLKEAAKTGTPTFG